MGRQFQIVARSEKETREIARALGEELRRTVPLKRGALVFALKGDLGSGKTTFIQGALKRIGIKKKTSSPTFVLVKRFPLARRGIKNIYHVDAYRVKSARELAPLGLQDIFQEKRSVVFIEWADKIRRAIPKNAIWISFAHDKPGERIIAF